MKTCNYRVYRDNLGDCSNHGLSSYVDSGLLFFDCSKESAIEYCQQNGLNPNYQFYLKKRILWNEDHSVAVPLVDAENSSLMFGGNFLYTSNGAGYHFDGERVVRPIPSHDRVETN